MRHYLVLALLFLMTAFAAAADSSSANPLPDAGFEAGPTANWAIADENSKILPDAAHTGTQGLRVGTPDYNSTGSSVSSARFAVTPDQEITLSFWARTKAKSGAVYLLFYKADGKWGKTVMCPVKTHDGEWHSYELKYKAPADAEKVGIWVHSYSSSSGTVDLDDFALGGIAPGTAAEAPPAPRKPKAIVVPEHLPPRPQPPVIILKLDDLKQFHGKVHPNWQRISDFLESRHIKAGFGIICETLQEATPEYTQWIKQRQASGLIEFWFHGWDHAVHEVNGEKFNEFNQRSYEEQRKRFDDAQRLAQEKLGFAFKAFGPPGGVGNGSFSDETFRVMADDPHMNCWLYPQPLDERGKKLEAAGKVTILDRVWPVNLEGAVGVPDSRRLIAGYARYPQRDYFVLQGHPGMWTPERFAEFVKIIDFLTEQKAVFMTPSEYVAKLRNAAPATQASAPDSAPLAMVMAAPLAVVPATQPTTPFHHPGLLNNAAELARIRAMIQANAEPWKKAFERLQSSKEASLTWTPHPLAVVDVGFYGKTKNGLVVTELKDAQAAYTHALLWVLTGQEAHAKKAAEILDAWSAVLQTHTGDNAKVQAAWVGSVFPLSAELLKCTYPQWTGAEQFSAMLKRAFVPLIIDGMPTYNGNWELSMCNALTAIGVFMDDHAIFDKGVFLWRKRVPAYFYMTSDGPLPVRPYGTHFSDEKLVKYHWHNPGYFVDGLCQETGRDLAHEEMGLSATLNTAEIAYHQGIDLYGEEAKRIVASMEFHANFRLGAPVPSWLCGGKLDMKSQQPTYEIGYNHFHNRMGIDLPLTQQLIAKKIRPSWIAMHMVWESLTHAELDRK